MLSSRLIAPKPRNVELSGSEKNGQLNCDDFGATGGTRLRWQLNFCRTPFVIVPVAAGSQFGRYYRRIALRHRCNAIFRRESPTVPHPLLGGQLSLSFRFWHAYIVGLVLRVPVPPTRNVIYRAHGDSVFLNAPPSCSLFPHGRPKMLPATRVEESQFGFVYLRGELSSLHGSGQGKVSRRCLGFRHGFA